MKRNQEEARHQKLLAEWLDSHKIRWCHVPNERRARVQYLVELKRQGVKGGFPDNLIFSRPANGWSDHAASSLAKGFVAPRGVALELKAPGEKPTNAQLAWLEMLRRDGWQSTWCDGFDLAIRWLMELGFGQ